MVTTRSASESYSVEVPLPKKLKISTRRSSSSSSVSKTSSSTSRIVEVSPPKKLKISTRRSSSSVAKTSSSTSRILHVKVAPPKKQQISTVSTVSEIPKHLYDVIQGAAKCRMSLTLNRNNRVAKRELEEYERRIPIIALNYQCLNELPDSWEYNPQTSFMAHVPKPPTPPKPKPKTKRKKITITWSSPNYHGPYLLNNEEQEVWNKFRINDTAEARKVVTFPIKPYLTLVNKDDMVAGLLGKCAVDAFNKSYHMYVNKDEDNRVSGAAVVECKYYKLTAYYIFYMIIEALEQGKPGVYEARLQCDPDSGARTVCRFSLTHREPEWKRPWVQPRPQSKAEAESDYETVEDGSSDPQDFYELTGLVHRRGTKCRGGFNYHNPAAARYRLIRDSGKSRGFRPTVGRPLSAARLIR